MCVLARFKNFIRHLQLGSRLYGCVMGLYRVIKARTTTRCETAAFTDCVYVSTVMYTLIYIYIYKQTESYFRKQYGFTTVAL